MRSACLLCLRNDCRIAVVLSRLRIALQETQELQKKQAWYQLHQISINKTAEQEYLSYCGEAMFRVHILEQRLNRYLKPRFIPRHQAVVFRINRSVYDTFPNVRPMANTT